MASCGTQKSTVLEKLVGPASPRITQGEGQAEDERVTHLPAEALNEEGEIANGRVGVERDQAAGKPGKIGQHP